VRERWTPGAEAGYEVGSVRRFVVGAVVVGLLAGAAGARAEEFVRRGGTTLWESERAAARCLEAIEEASEADKEGAPENPGLFPAPACSAGKVLTGGTRVAPATPKGRCGKLAKVRVVSGRFSGAIGCVAADALSRRRVAPVR